MKKHLIYSLGFSLLIGCTGTPHSDITIKSDMRAPSYPLISVHPDVALWTDSDNLNEDHVKFSNGKPLPLVGFLRVDGAVYRFMGAGELPMQTIAPIAMDKENWQAKYTMIAPDGDWEQPGFDDTLWQTGHGAFGTPDLWEVKTNWLSSNIWVRREVAFDKHQLKRKKFYLRYSHDDVFQLYINGKQLVSTGFEWGGNFKTEIPDSILTTMLDGKAVIAAHCENRTGGALVDFGIYAEDPTVPVQTIAPISFEGGWEGRYTLAKPSEGWEQMNYDDAGWASGAAAFGTDDQRHIKTPWLSSDIWVRREITFDKELPAQKQLYLRYSHDDVFQLYVNGKQLVSTAYEWRGDIRVDIPDSIAETMKDGKAVIAAHCENRTGGGLIDFGLYAEMRKARQLSVDVQATQTHYVFECGGVNLNLSFTTPALMNNIEAVARPVNYISYQAVPLDGKEHKVDIYFELDPHIALKADEMKFQEKEGTLVLKAGNTKQKLWMNPEKDAPAWGYFYLGSVDNVTHALGDAAEMRNQFTDKGELNSMRAGEDHRYAAIAQTLKSGERGKLMVGFDGLYSMTYFGQDLRPYWNKTGKNSMESEMTKAGDEYDGLVADCYDFDRRLMFEAYQAGGKEYAELCALAYRQTMSVFQMSESPDGDLLYFTQEVGPVDVYYPSAPMFLCYNPELLKAMLNPIFYYSESGRWTKPFPAHDLGGYPIVNGQTGGYDMPVEEAGNMLIMTAAITKVTDDTSYAKKHWKVLSRWADYLVTNGLDTQEQFSSDNFAGECFHNTNLSAKLILGVASYAYLAEALGHKEKGKEYMDIARTMAVEWEKNTRSGDHYRMAFDQEDTWSQKYNLVWNKLLGLNVFPETVAQTEVTFYQTKLNRYGFPLDSRHTRAKADWMVWSASLAADREAFRKLIIPLHRFMNETSARTPMADLINTDQNTIIGFTGRPVVGGYFIRLLENRMRNDL